MTEIRSAFVGGTLISRLNLCPSARGPRSGGLEDAVVSAGTTGPGTELGGFGAEPDNGMRLWHGVHKAAGGTAHFTIKALVCQYT